MPVGIMKKHLSGFLKEEKDSPLFFIFPLHDWDVPKYYVNILKNISEFNKYKDSVDWMDIIKMREAFLSAGKVDQ